MKTLITKLFHVESNDRHTRRIARVLFPILSGSIVLASLAFTINLSSYIQYLSDPTRFYYPSSTLPIFLFLIAFLLLFHMTRKGNVQIVSMTLVIFYFSSAAYSALQWGVDVPQALLMYSLTIIMAGILLGSKMGFISTIIVITTQFTLTYLQLSELISADSYWKNNFISYKDTLVTSITLSIIAIVSWLSNKEIEKSLSRAESSERALRKERDMLEVRVEQRTRDLHKAQVDKMMQLYRFADFGKRASGLIHELVNPLTVVSINLEKLERESKSITPHDYSSLQTIIKRAVDGTQKIEKYVQAARTQIHSQDSSTRLSVVSQTKKVLTSFKQLTDQHDINVSYKISHKPLIYGSSIKFSQCITHLVANAIDALKTSDSDRRLTVSIKVDAQKKARISIHNNGPTIPEKELDTIFDAFYSTKSPIHGMGLGLSITKDIIEESFNGKISVTSTQNSGTTFTIVIPVSSKAS